ncbi:MAG: DUF2269 family protein [Burkholderiales bacterium]|nr:DUF2269 family protein [Anaerolineae bacterium]
MPLFMKFLHVITAFWFVTGLIGRNLTMRQAARTPDIHITAALVKLAGRFEMLMVRPGSFLVLGFGIVAAVMQGWPILGSLQGGTSNWLFVSTLIYLGMIPIIPLIFIPRGKVFGAALENAVAQGTFTPELKAAFTDPVVAAAHAAELIGIVVIIILMVMKPF